MSPSPDVAQRRRTLARRRGSAAGTYLLLVLLAIPFVFPVYWMFVVALKHLGDVFESPPKFWPDDPQWGNFIEVMQSGPFLQQFFNSFYIALTVTAGVLILGTLAGYAFARITFPGRNLDRKSVV